MALKTDLVLMAEINNPQQVKALEGLGLTVYYLNNPITLEDMYANLETVAKLTGHEQEAALAVVGNHGRCRFCEKLKRGFVYP